MKTQLHQRLEADFDALPDLQPSDPRYAGVKQTPEYLGMSGNFYSATSHAVQNIGECVAIARDPNTKAVLFCDANHRWWANYFPHVRKEQS